MGCVVDISRNNINSFVLYYDFFVDFCLRWLDDKGRKELVGKFINIYLVLILWECIDIDNLFYVDMILLDSVWLWNMIEVLEN